MPREIFGPYEYSKFQKYLSGPLKVIRNIEATPYHTTIAYWILPASTNPAQVCDNCGDKASFILYDRDHMAQTTVYLWCKGHARPEYEEWLNEAEL